MTNNQRCSSSTCEERKPPSSSPAAVAAAATLLRTKPGRKDIQAHLRSSSMSCSDKLARWSCLGVQGALLSGLLQAPVHLAGLVLSADPGACAGAQLMSLQRAVVERVSVAFPPSPSSTSSLSSSSSSSALHMKGSLRPVLPHLALSSSMFPQGKSSSETPGGSPASSALPAAGGGAPPPPLVDSCAAASSKRQLKRAANPTPSAKPAGNNLNWIRDVPCFAEVPAGSSSGASAPRRASGTVEVTIATTGILQGCTATAVVAARAGEGRSASKRKLDHQEGDSVGSSTSSSSAALEVHPTRVFTGEDSAVTFQSRLSQRYLFPVIHRLYDVFLSAHALTLV